MSSKKNARDAGRNGLQGSLQPNTVVRGAKNGGKRKMHPMALGCYLVPVHKWLFFPKSSLLSKFNPRNISYMPAVKFIERLDLEKTISFLDRHYLEKRKQSGVEFSLMKRHPM